MAERNTENRKECHPRRAKMQGTKEENWRDWREAVEGKIEGNVAYQSFQKTHHCAEILVTLVLCGVLLLFSRSLSRARFDVWFCVSNKNFVRVRDYYSHSLSLSRVRVRACGCGQTYSAIVYALRAMRVCIRFLSLSLFLSNNNNTSASSTCPRRPLVCAKRGVARGEVGFASRVSPRRTSTSRRRFLRFWRERESFIVRIREVLIAYRESSRLFREARRVFRAT